MRELPALAQGRYGSRRLIVPTLLLVGSEDPVIRVGNLGGYEDHADDMAVSELRGVGHWIVDEAPDERAELGRPRAYRELHREVAEGETLHRHAEDRERDAGPEEPERPRRECGEQQAVLVDHMPR